MQSTHATREIGPTTCASAQPGHGGDTAPLESGARAFGADGPASAPAPDRATCTCTGDVRATGFTATGPKAETVPAHWFVHAGCGLPTSAYREAMLASDSAGAADLQGT